MRNNSPLAVVQGVETQIKLIIRTFDAEQYNAETVKAMKAMRQLITDARLDIRDYEYADSQAEQQKYAMAAKKRLAKVQSNILTAGDVFSVADTAQILAEIELISGLLE